MDREVIVKRKALKQLYRLEKAEQSRILFALQELQIGFRGDIRKLSQSASAYRLRVGRWRVLFEIDNQGIVIYFIGLRRDAYR